MLARTGEELLKICKENNISLSEYAIRCEVEEKGLTREEVIEKMRKNLNVMIAAAKEGTEKEVYSVSGLIGGDGHKLYEYSKSKKTLTGRATTIAMAMALASSEVNASMGKIVACPTAGAVETSSRYFSCREVLELNEDELIKGLLAAAAVGLIIGLNATLSGAEGGCQAECGSASAMGAAAVVEMMGGTPKMSLDAGSIILQNILGLVCDPVAGLVEIPCAKRNAQGAITALCTADMVMAGIEAKIPFDEAVIAMYKVGKSLPSSLRETAMGGIATTPTGLRLKKQVFGEE